MDRITAAVLARRGVVVALLAVLAALSSALALRDLRTDADTDSLIGEQQPFMADYRAFKREFGDLEYLIVVVDAKPPGASSLRAAEAMIAVRALVDRFKALPELREVHGLITPEEQMRLAPRSCGMSEAELRGLLLASDAFPAILSQRPAAQILAEAQAGLESLLPVAPGAEAPQAEAGSAVPSALPSAPTRAPSPSDGAMDRASLERRGAAAIFALSAIAAGAPVEDPEFPLALERPIEWLTVARPPAPVGRFLFVLLMPGKDYGTLAVIDEPLRRIREVIAEVQAQVPDVEIGLTGKPVLQADEMETTARDMTRAALAGVVLVSILFMLVFRSIRRPLLAVVCFGVGAALTVGAATVLVGRLNLLSIVFMLVLVGVGLDYGIHMIARYSEGLRHLARRGAIRHMMRTAAPSNATGAFIAGGVFLLALATPFQGLRELGLIAGIGLLLCMAVMTLLLPALLDLLDRSDRTTSSFIQGRHKPGSMRLRPRHAALIAVAIGGALLLAPLAPSRLRFESNLLELQAPSVTAVEWERRILAENASETWFAVVIVDRIEEIPSVLERARAEPAIGSARSVLDLVAMPTPSREALLEALAEATVVATGAGAGTELRRSPPLDPSGLLAASTTLERLAPLASLQAPEEAKRLRGLASRLRLLADGLDPARHDEAMIEARMQAVDDALLRTARSLAQMGDGARRSLRDALPAALRDEYTSRDGRFAVMLHPTSDVWEFEPMRAFVEAIRRVDPHATGVPITHFESMLLMERSFAIQAILAVIFVVIVLFADLRSIAETLACVTTLGVAVAWTLGVMMLLGVSFNLANFFAIPITIGLGSDACIHVAHRAREGLADGFGSTRRAVTVTAMTTVIGFGGLLFAHHRGLQSLGVLMVVATLAMLAATTLVLPALLRLRSLRSSQ